MNQSIMKAIVTTGNGDYDRLVYQDVPVPELNKSEALIKVLAAGVNNTDINTRVGWYSSSVKTATNASSTTIEKTDGGWNKQTPFPFIQGTDCCGEVVAVSQTTEEFLVNKRVLIRPCMRVKDFSNWEHVWMGSDFNGAFAEYVKVPVTEVFPISCDWSDVELGSIPCSYGTAENMLLRAGVKSGDTILVTGASGGVGSATIQLAKLRGVKVIAIASQHKHEKMSQLGVAVLLDRAADLMAEPGEKSIDIVVDNVAGKGFPDMLKLLKRGGRLVSSGAIAGPVVSFDMRELYLKDIQLIGSTAWDEPVFQNLINYIEQGRLKPVVAETFALSSIVEAQKKFLDKKHVGKLVLTP